MANIPFPMLRGQSQFDFVRFSEIKTRRMVLFRLKKKCFFVDKYLTSPTLSSLVRVLDEIDVFKASYASQQDTWGHTQRSLRVVGQLSTEVFEFNLQAFKTRIFIEQLPGS